MGKLSIAKLPVGAYRALTKAEVTYLHSLADRPAEPVVEKSARPAKFGGRRRGKPQRQKNAAGFQQGRQASRPAAKRREGRRIIH
jgi:hypothetical protein